MPLVVVTFSRHRFSGRFWDPYEILELLSIYYGSTCDQFPRTWQYRTLIGIHREKYSDRYTRKGYGPDWKEDIKDDVQAFMSRGQLPTIALRRGAESIRQAEQTAWMMARARNSQNPKSLVQEAAE